MKRPLKLIGCTLLFIVGACALVSIFHAPIFRAAAKFWIVDTIPEHQVDAILIPGGSLETRPFEAAKLYQDGVSNKIVTFATEVLPSEALGLTRPSHEVTIKILEKLGVPASNIEVIHAAVTSTQDEVIATRKWFLEKEIHSILIMTDIFPSRRVNWAYRNGLSNLDVEISIHPAPARLYTADNWWQHEHGLIAFQNEIIKYLYYLIRY